MGDQLEIRSTTTPNGNAHLAIVGEIDLASAPRFRDALEQATSTHSAIAIDLRGVTYFDSAGVDALFRYAPKHRIKLTIGDNETIAAVIKVSGLGQLVTLENGADNGAAGEPTPGAAAADGIPNHGQTPR